MDTLKAILRPLLPRLFFRQPFSWLQAYTGFDLPRSNAAVCYLLAIPLAFLFRLLPFGRPRHIASLIIGVSFSLFCFRLNILHILFMSVLSHALILLAGHHRFLHWMMIVLTFSYLCHQIWFHESSYYTLQLMILAQKMTSLACSIVDGRVPREEIKPKLRPYAITTPPTPLEFYSYIFFFPMCLHQGPHTFFSEFRAFMDGTGLRAPAHASIRPVVYKTLASFAFLMLCRFPGIMRWPETEECSLFSDPTFLRTHSYPARLWSMITMFFQVRMRFYAQWAIIDAGANAAGYGFQGYDTQGKALWQGASNFDIIEVEFAVNDQRGLDSWHHQVSRWIKYVAWHRTGSLLFAKSLLAFWHGIHPHFLLLWLTFPPITEGSKRARASFHPFFALHPRMLWCYDVFTWAFSMLFYSPYTFAAFLCDDIRTAFNAWGSMLYLGHVLAVVGCLLLPGHGPHPLMRWLTIKMARVLRVDESKIDWVHVKKAQGKEDKGDKRVAKKGASGSSRKGEHQKKD